MITKMSVKYWALFFFFIGGSLAFSEDGSQAKAYPVPVTEMAGMMEGWLSHSGYTVSRSPGKSGQVIIVGVRNDQNFKILLTPRSPLATDVKAEYRGQGEIDGTPLTQMHAHIENYLKDVSGNPDSSLPSLNRMPVAPGQNVNETIPNAVLNHLESVVCIRAEVEAREIQFSGFLIDPDGLIVCTAHDLKNLKNIRVALFDGREIEARLLKVDSRKDLVLLKLEAHLERFISLSDGRNLLNPGETLYSMGCPLNHQGTVYSGTLSGPPRKVDGLSLWQVDMKVFPGSSGGPVFDAQGNLVAIVKGRYRGTDSIGFLIPLETIIAFITEAP